MLRHLRACALALLRLHGESEVHTVLFEEDALVVDVGDVHKHILAAIIRHQEPVALVRVEPLDFAVYTHGVITSDSRPKVGTTHAVAPGERKVIHGECR